MTAADLKGRWPHKRLFLSLSLSLEIRLIFFYSFFFSSSDGCGVFQEWLLRLRLREVHVANSADALGRCTHRTDTATAEEIFKKNGNAEAAKAHGDPRRPLEFRGTQTKKKKNECASNLPKSDIQLTSKKNTHTISQVPVDEKERDGKRIQHRQVNKKNYQRTRSETNRQDKFWRRKKNVKTLGKKRRPPPLFF